MRTVVAAARRHGVASDELLGAVGLTPEHIAGEDARVPAAVELRLWEVAVRLTQDADFPLRVAAELRPGTFGAFDYAARTSASLGDAYRRVVRYRRLVHEGVLLTLEVHGAAAVLTRQTLGAVVEPSPARSVFALAALLVAGRQATGLDFAPREVAFQQRRPRRVDELERLFRAPVRFGAPTDRLVLDAALLRYPLVRADAGLCRILDQQATALLAQLPAGVTLAARVRWLLAEEIRSGTPRAVAVARRLHVSPRQLQRCLAREGTSFHELAAGLQRSLAEHLLADPELPVGAVAARLGFSTPSAFHRAYKRWTGTTPASVRRRRRRGDA